MTTETHSSAQRGYRTKCSSPPSRASLDLESWAGGARHAFVAISLKEITGRVIVHPVMSVE